MSKPFRVAYMMSRFPKITETFILYEILAVMAQGVKVEIYPLMREHTDMMHPEAVPLVQEAHFTPHISLGILGINLRTMVMQPGKYFKVLWTSLRATCGSRRYFFGVLIFFAKSVYLAHRMQKAKIAHLHAHFASFPAVSAYIIHQFADIPYSFTAHGSDLHRDKHMLCEKVHGAKFVVAISEYNRDVILNHCGTVSEEKVRIIHCGVDTSTFKPVGKETANSNPLNIVCIGTLHEVKGQTYLIQACQQLNQRGIDFTCHFVGDGPDYAKLQTQVVEAGLDDQIIFHGSVPRIGVLTALSQADIIALTSVPSSDGRREGIPVALMEGMAFGVPVVASDLSGIPELVENGVSGLLVPPQDVAGIADSLERLAINPKLRKQLGQAGRQKIHDQFDLEQNAILLTALFKEATP